MFSYETAARLHLALFVAKVSMGGSEAGWKEKNSVLVSVSVSFPECLAR